MEAIEIPSDWPVQPIDPQTATDVRDAMTCGQCEQTWDDGISTSMTPVPSGRCPFEIFHAFVDLPTAPTSDPDLLAWLNDNDYANVDEWAQDSDYHYEPDAGEWYDEDGNWIDPEEQAFYAMEASQS